MYKAKPKEYQDRVVVEFSPNSPKLRFSIFAALIDNGFLHDYQPNELTNTMDEALRFITSGNADFMNDLEFVADEDEDEDEDDADVITKQVGAGYL